MEQRSYQAHGRDRKARGRGGAKSIAGSRPGAQRRFPPSIRQPEARRRTVADVLKEPDKYSGKTLADPFEGPAYGRGKAMLFRNADESLVINSFAHGGAVYELTAEQPPDADELGERNAASIKTPPPRAWLLGNVFCRTFLSSVIAEGGTGKTALRYAQLLSLAIGRSLTGERVWQRCVVLIISLEDSEEELDRRICAVMRHYGVDPSEVDGWLWIRAPGAKAGKLMTVNRKGRPEEGTMAAMIERAIVRRKVDIVSLDPFVKTHGVSENDNNLIDQVTQVLPDLSATYDIAVDTPHHVRKGPSDPGNADRARGASSQKDAYRLVYTLSTMSPEEAETFESQMRSGTATSGWTRERSTSFRHRGRRNGLKSSASALRMRPNSIPTATRSKRSNRGRRRRLRRARHPDLQPHPRRDRRRLA